MVHLKKIVWLNFISLVLAAGQSVMASEDYRALDQETQLLKSAVLDLNQELNLLSEEMLYPASSQVAVFVSMDVGEFFALDGVELTLDGKNVSNHLYDGSEVNALHRGGVHKIYLGNLKDGEHELVAIFTGVGPHGRDYRRGAKLNFSKSNESKYVELVISDREQKLRPEFYVREWE
jgi:hypothetical protein